MNTFDINGFLYNGRKYNFTAIISWSNEDPKKSTALDNNHINSFMYQNEVNSLFLVGNVIYTDTTGLVDKILDKQYAYCEINFYEMEVKSDNDIVTEIPSPTHVFYHKFYINSIEILDRLENSVKYKFNLVGRNWFNCISNVSYTNYLNDKEDIVDIIKAILGTASLIPNTDTFDLVKSGVKINYITNLNDNAMTSIGYLLEKMYYYHDRLDRMQYLIYNEHTDKYEMFDVLNPNTWFNTFPLAVTFFKNSIEQLANAEMANFATVTKFPKTDMHKMFNNVKYYDFDIKLNHVIWEAIPSETIMNYYNNFNNIGGEYDIKTVGLYKCLDDLKYNRFSTYWNNTNSRIDIKLYNEAVNCYLGNNSLVVNTAGNILEKPGSIVDISIDRDIKSATGDDVDDTQELLNKYKAFEGRWFTTKVLTFLDLRQMRFTQNLILSRNFLKK